MDRKSVAGLLQELGVLLELKGENPFKTRAYLNAGRAIEGAEEELETLVAQGTLADLKGVGQAIAAKVTELVTTGRLEYYENVKASVEPGLVEMLRIQGLGTKKVRALHDRLGIATVEELEDACRSGRVATLEGFGVKSQEKILAGIEALKSARHLFLYPVAFEAAEQVRRHLQETKGLQRLSIAGSLRRRKGVIRDLDLVASSRNPGSLMERFAGAEGVERVLAKGPTKSSVILSVGPQADLRVVSDEEFPFALQYFTGSKEHNTSLRRRAQGLGLKLNEYGLFHGQERIGCADEEAIYQRLGLDFIPPELREDTGEVEAAEDHTLPRLIEDRDLKGTLHVHTDYSDGRASLATMVQAARKLGFHYLGIADHSRSARYAGGLSEDRVQQQWEEIDRLNEGVKGFRILKGIESDILSDGSLDYDDEFIGRFDFVVASVHSRFNLPAGEMTQRIIRAIQHPAVTILGHPTGRLLLSREPYAVDLHKVLDAAAETGTVVEINAHPQRLDLDWSLCRYAKERGVRFSIDPDSHNANGLADVVYGVFVARRGWLSAADVINTYSLKKIGTFLAAAKAERSTRN